MYAVRTRFNSTIFTTRELHSIINACKQDAVVILIVKLYVSIATLT